MSDKTLRKHNGPPASHEFRDALTGGGSTTIYCSWCGRTHVAIDSSNMWCGGENGDEECSDRQEYIQANAENPDTTILHYDCDFVTGKDIDGHTIVEDCPCNGLRRYEDWMWKYRHVFKHYMANMHKKLQDDMKSIEGIVIPG